MRWSDRAALALAYARFGAHVVAAPFLKPRVAPPPFSHELRAAAPWQRLDLISDLHLTPENFGFARAALDRYLQDDPGDALFILGDLFEVWIGDDAAADDPFAQDCAALLRRLSAAVGGQLFFMHGNRDFLLGDDFLQRCGATLLADPTVLLFADARWLLTHGDALCLADTTYLAYRTQVRQPGFQRGFLARPLAARQATARRMRARSGNHQSDQPPSDVDAGLARRWLLAANAPIMIHGHTHRPAVHALGSEPADPPLERWVLSDWDAQASPPRHQLLRLERDATGAAALRRIELAAG